MITGRAADTLTVRTTDGTNQTVTLTDSTKVKTPKGLGLRSQDMSWAELIPGLKVQIKGTPDGSGNFIAQEVKFNKDDLETASMIQAGLAPTEQRVAANAENISTNAQNISTNQQNIATNATNIDANKKQIATDQEAVQRRFSALADYEVKNQAVVYFASGKTTLGEKEKAALSQLAGDARNLSGYIVEVQGFADSTGNLAANQTLSKERAFAVINYLMQEGNIPPRHLVSPGAMGISSPAASNETAQGRSENRRVEVKVLVNKGVAMASQ